MKVEFEDRTWELDTNGLSLAQAMVITGRMGMSLTRWQKTLADVKEDDFGTPEWLQAMQCLYWLMLAQDGQHVPIGDAVNFAVLELANAYGDAYLRENPPEPESEPDPTSSAAQPGAAESPPEAAVTG